MGRAARLALLLAAAAAPASAHHGWNEYDGSNVLKLTGKIVDSGYENPHGHVVLQTPDKTWHVLLAAPLRMQSRGLSRQMLAPGGTASVEGYPSRHKPDEVRAERITIQGKTVELR